MKKFSVSPKALLFIVSIPAIIGAYYYGPLPGAATFSHDIFTNQLTYAASIDEFLNSIPRKYSVAATNNVGSHLSHRQQIYTIPIGVDKADIIVMLLNDQYAQPSLKAQFALATKLKQDTTYTKVFEQNDFVVFVKNGVALAKQSRRQRGWGRLFPLFR
jgi:hypothetical protein